MSDSLLEIRNLTKRYGENTVLRDLSFTVRRGEVIVVLGPSGCGKSTLLRCINALEPIQGGEILLGGEVIDRSPAGLPALRRRIGMVFQSYELFPHMTVMENILLAPCKALGTKKEDAKAEAAPGRPVGKTGQLPTGTERRTKTAGGHCAGAVYASGGPAL